MFRYSTISDYYKCGQFYLHKHVNQEVGTPQPGGALDFGTAIHLAVQAAFEGEDAIDVFTAAWEAHKATNQTFYGGETWESLLKDGQMLMSKFSRLHLKHLNPEFIEETLSGVVGDHKFTGTVDFAGQYKGVTTVLDFKTSAKPYPKERLQHNDQLFVYNHLLRQMGKLVPYQHAYMVFKKSKWGQDAGIQVITREVTDREIQAAMSNIKLVCDQIVAGVFTKNTQQCMMGTYRCEYFTKCYGG